MLTLGIESTAHTFGISIFDGKKFLSNSKDSYTTTKGGMIPPKVGDHHVDVCDKVILESLESAGVSMKDIDLISFSISPGIGHALRIGSMVAKSLSTLYKIPLIGVNHCIAHLEIGRHITGAQDPVLLYASGANTQIIAYEAQKYRIFGETLDIGIGNFLDCFAQAMGLGFPGGPQVSAMADKGGNYIELPYSVKGMDVSFGGLLTNLKQKIKSKDYDLNALAYSAQETVFAMLLEVSERALAHCDKTELLLGGGVACNTRLQEMSKKMCEERGAKCYILENQYNVDNAAMIAQLGALQYEAGDRLEVKDVVIRPYERTDEVDVMWR